MTEPSYREQRATDPTTTYETEESKESDLNFEYNEEICKFKQMKNYVKFFRNNRNKNKTYPNKYKMNDK